MSVKRCFSIAMLIVGTVIGAGFASGAEIASFFGRGISPINALFCALLLFGGCALFLALGSAFKPRDVGELHTLAFGKVRTAADGFLLVNSLIVVAGMLAAFGSIGRDFLGMNIPVLPFVFGATACVIVSRGINGVIKVNAIAIPAVIITLSVTAVMSMNARSLDFHLTNIRPITSVVYIAMNLILAAGALSSVRELNKKEIILSSALAAGTIGLLMLGVILSLNAHSEQMSLPMLSLASRVSPVLFWLMLAAMSVSVFTTLLTAMSCLTDYSVSVLHSRPLASLCVFAVGALLSVLGFDRVVGTLYPLIGLIGVVYILFLFIFVLRGRISRAIRTVRG